MLVSLIICMLVATTDYLYAYTTDHLYACTTDYLYAFSVSCQFSDIGSHNQLSNEQKRSESEQTRSFARNVP